MSTRFLACIALFWVFLPARAVEITSVTEDYPPFEYVENGEVKGFTIDLLKQLYAKTGHTGKAQVLPWARAYDTALHEPNVLVHRMTRSQQREPLFKWIGKVSDKRVSLYKLKKRADIQLQDLADAKQYGIGTIGDQSSTKFLYRQGFEEGVNTFSVPTLEMNIKKLFAGRVDMLLAMEPILRFRMKEMGYPFAEVEEAVAVDHDSEFHMAFSSQTPDALVAQFRAAFEQLKADGSFDRLWEKYFGH